MENFDFGRNLLSLRQNKSLTQEELSDLVGVSDMAVSQWEANLIRPRPRNIAKLCKVLGVSEIQLLGYEVKHDPREKEDFYIKTIDSIKLVHENSYRDLKDRYNKTLAELEKMRGDNEKLRLKLMELELIKKLKK